VDFVRSKCSYTLKFSFLNIIATPLEGFLIIETDVYRDERGFFLETYHKDRYIQFGITDSFVQDNQSRSSKGILRGMHFQVKRPQAQMVTVLRGTVYDVGVDLRPTSPTFGKWHGVEISDSGPNQIYMAPGFAHGFYVMSEFADLHYKVTRFYDAHDEGGLLWNDPTVGVQWPHENPEISLRDAAYPKLKDLLTSQLPHNPPLEK
jgi:dTDP-4-dehydrorhamnose 3,5-epimerase